MTKPVPVLLFAVMAAIAAPDLGGQASTMPQPNAAASPKVPISPALVLREITLNLRDGTIVRGRLSAATAASILVRQDDQEQEYALRDIRKAIVDPKPQRAKGVLPGIVLGFYAGNISLSYFPTPGFYVETYHGIRVFSLDPFWGQALIAAVGGFLGSRTPARGPRRVFVFPDDFGRSRGTAREFAGFLAGKPAPARVHFLIQNGFLVAGFSRSFGRFAEENGFAQGSAGDVSRLSLLRSLELSYSIRARLRTGLRVSFPSEPAFYGYSRDEGLLIKKRADGTVYEVTDAKSKVHYVLSVLSESPGAMVIEERTSEIRSVDIPLSEVRLITYRKANTMLTLVAVAAGGAVCLLALVLYTYGL